MTERDDTIESGWLKRNATVISLCALVLIHGLCLRNGFVDFDDDTIFLKNPHFTLSWIDFLSWSFDLNRPDTWRPLRDLSHFIDLQIHGQDPLWAHAHNLMLLLVTASLGIATFRSLGLSGTLAATVILIGFAHPAQVEVVTWISGRKDLLAAPLCLGAILAFIQFVRTRDGYMWGGLVILLTCAGVMAKGHLVVMPLVLFWVYLLLRNEMPDHQDRRGRPIISLLGILATGAILIAPRIAGGGISLPTELQQHPGQSILIGDKLQLPIRYLARALWPTDLNHIYFTPTLDAWHTPMAVISVLFTLWMLWLIFTWTRKGERRGPLLAIGCTLMLPYLHLRTGVVYMADRYLFLSLPFFVLVTILTIIETRWWIGLTQKSRFVMTLVLIGVLATGCLRPHAAFHDSVSLWTRMTEVYPNSAWSYDRLGRALYHETKYPEAAAAWLLAAERAPHAVKHLNNAAVAAMAIGRNLMAIELLLQVLKVEPSNELALRNLEIIRTATEKSRLPSRSSSEIP